MELSKCKNLPAKHNWTPMIKKCRSSIFVVDHDPLDILSHFAVAVVHTVKVYGQYGKLTERYKTACIVINHALKVNKFVVPHSKVQGQHLWFLNHEMLQSWVENLIDNFSVDEANHYFQGDEDAGTVAEEIAAGIS
jgi:hypothetical protein